MVDNESTNEQVPDEQDEKQQQDEVQEDQQQQEESQEESQEEEQQDEKQEEEKFQCDVEIDDSGPWKKKIQVNIPREEIDKELNEQYKELRRTADIPGFRKGRAPRRLVEKRFGNSVLDQTKYKLIGLALEQVEEKEDFEILGEPDFDPEKIEFPKTDDFSFEYEVEVKPVFELPKLEGIRVEKQVAEITTERIDSSLEQLRYRQGKMQEVDTVKADDRITAGVTMKIEGVESPEVLEGYDLWAGTMAVRGVTIEELGKVLEGAKVGDTRTCSVENIPDTHEKEEYRGKKADFSIKINKIERLIPAEITEEFCKSFGAETEEELRREIQEDIEERADQESRRLMAQQIHTYLLDNTDFELPEGVAGRHSARFLDRRYSELLRQGVPQEQIDQNIEQLKASTTEEAIRDLKMSFIMEKIHEELDISVSEGEVNASISQMAMTYRQRPEKLRDQLARDGRLDAVRDQIRDDKAFGRLLEMAEVVDAPAADEIAENDEKNKPAKKIARKDVKRKPPSADS